MPSSLSTQSPNQKPESSFKILSFSFMPHFQLVTMSEKICFFLSPDSFHSFCSPLYTSGSPISSQCNIWLASSHGPSHLLWTARVILWQRGFHSPRNNSRFLPSSAFSTFSEKYFIPKEEHTAFRFVLYIELKRQAIQST